MNVDADKISPKKSSFRDPWLWGILGVTFAVRIIYLYCFIKSPLYRLYRADHQFYREWGKQIASGNFTPGNVFEQGPLYAYLLGGFYRIFGVNDLLLFVFQMALGIGTTWMVYRIGLLIFDRATARLAAMICGLYSPMMFYETMVMKTCLTAFLITLAGFGLLQYRALKGQRLWLIVSAVCVGLLILIRENYLLMLPVLCVASWFVSPAVRMKKLQHLLLPITVVVLVTLPATLHNYAVSQRFVWVTAGGGEVLYMAWGPDATGYYQPPPFIRPDPVFEHEDFRLEASRRLNKAVDYQESSVFWKRTAIAELFQNPIRSLKLVIFKLLILFNDFEVPDSAHYGAYSQFLFPLPYLITFGWVVGFGLVGLVIPAQDRCARWCLLAIIGVTALSVMMVYNFARFRLGMMPLWIVFTAAGAVAVFRNLKADSRLKQTAAMLVLILGVGISILSFLPPPGYVEAGYSDVQSEVVEMVNRRQKALESLSELESSHETIGNINSEQRLDLISKLLEAQLHDQAIRKLEEWIASDDQNSMAYGILGAVHAKLGHDHKAEEILLQAVALNPTEADLRANLGSVYFHRALQGSLAIKEREQLLLKAREVYESGLLLEPDHPTCLQGIRGIDQSLKLAR